MRKKCAGLKFDAFLPQFLNDHRISDMHGGRRSALVVGADGLRCFGSIVSCPSLGQPSRMRRLRIKARWPRLLFRHLSQNCVDKSGGRALPRALRQFNTLIDGSMLWDSIEKDQLV